LPQFRSRLPLHLLKSKYASTCFDVQCLIYWYLFTERRGLFLAILTTYPTMANESGYQSTVKYEK
jgi:hypothetical protein